MSQKKQYPKNEVYSQSYKPTFQEISKSREQKKIVNISGTSLSQISVSSITMHSQNQVHPNLKSIKNNGIAINPNTNPNPSKANPNPMPQPSIQPTIPNSPNNASLNTNANTTISVNNGSSSTEISVLHDRIEYLQKELEMVTQLLLQQQSRKNIVEKLEQRIQDLQENLDKTEEINKMLENQFMKSQNSNNQLVNALKFVNEQLEALKLDQQNDSKQSKKSKQQVQEDIIRLNQQISNILVKMHALNEDYEIVQQKNQSLQTQKQQLLQQIQQLKNKSGGQNQRQIASRYKAQQQQLHQRISELQAEISQQVNTSQKYKSQYQYKCQQINLLKQQIQQVNQLSIRKQKQIQDQYYEKQRLLNEQLEKIKNQLRESRISINSNNSGKMESRREAQGQGPSSNLVEIKNVMIRKLELDNQVLRQELQAMDRQLRRIKQNQKNIEIQYNYSNRKVTQVTDTYKQKIFQLEQVIRNKASQLEQQGRNIVHYQQRLSALQNQNMQCKSEARNKQQKIYNLQQQNRDLRRKQYRVQQLQQQLDYLKNKQSYGNSEIYQIQNKRSEITDDINKLKRQLQNIQRQVKLASQVKQKYGSQISALKLKIRQLNQNTQNQALYIKSIESSHQNSRKKFQDLQSVTSGNMVNNQRVQQLQKTNKQLQKMLIDQKVQKQNQNTRYKQLLEDYKQLNHQLSTELQLYRDSKNVDHPHCPLPLPANLIKDISYLKESREKPLTVISHKSNNSDTKKELEKQRSKYRSLLEQHQKTLQRYKNVQSKMHQLQKSQRQINFLKIDNSSLRAQVTQQNYRIEQHKNTIQILQKQSDNRHIDAEKLRFSLQRQYEGKLQIQRMQIINEYNVLLRNRNVRIEPTQFKNTRSGPNNYNYVNTFNPQVQQTYQNPQKYSQPIPHILPGPQSPSHSSLAPPFPDSKIRHHPQYKALQQQYMKIYRKLLQTEQYFNKALIQCKDQIQKLKIENQYHRKTIDQLHAEGYGVYEDGSVYSQGYSGHSGGQGQFRNMYEELSRNYQKLYDQYVAIKSKTNSQAHHLIPSRFTDPKKSLINPQIPNQIQKTELTLLKKLIDEKLIELQLTPREPASTLQRASWLIQKLTALIQQLRQDIGTLKGQKKELGKENDRLRVQLETFQYQNCHLLKELAVVAQKFKYLEERNLKIANGSFISLDSPARVLGQPHIPKITLNKSPPTYSTTQIQQTHPNSSYPYTQTYIHPLNTNNTTNTNPNTYTNNSVYQNNSINGNANGNQKDVYFHEAKLIREQRLALLKKYERDIESLDRQI